MQGGTVLTRAFFPLQGTMNSSPPSGTESPAPHKDPLVPPGPSEVTSDAAHPQPTWGVGPWSPHPANSPHQVAAPP